MQDHGSMGEINNFAKVMDTCWQQSSVNGIEVINGYTSRNNLKTSLFLLSYE